MSEAWTRLRSAAALAAGGAGVALIVAKVGPGRIAHDLALAGWALPAMAAIHAVQLLLSALAWREALGHAPGQASPSRRLIFLARWVREGVNALLPTAQIGGQVAGVSILVRGGIPAVHGVAGVILDLTVEAAAQFLFTLAGMGVLLAGGGDRHWLRYVAAGAACMGLGAAAMLLAQRLGLLRLIESALERAAATWPLLEGWSLAGLHDRLMARLADRRAILRAGLLQLAAWSLGSAEVWVALRALQHPLTPGNAFVVESLAMAARSAGFAVPAAIGVQEGGFVLVCALFGVPAGAALSLSVLKRVREVAVGAPALWVWQGRRKERKSSFSEEKEAKRLLFLRPHRDTNS
jgi:putative membrane protein